ncbi:MAG: T3SS effector HopA1 family protein [Candidatus Saccharimonadales bacterium]
MTEKHHTSTHETFILPPQLSFDTLRSVERPFSDTTIERIVVGDLSGEGFSAATDIQRWSSLARPTAAEVSLMHNPSAIAGIHKKTADMIRQHGHFHIDPNRVGPQEKEILRLAIQAQKDALAADDGGVLERRVQLWRQGQGAGVKLVTGAKYAHCSVSTTKGPLDLSDRFGKKVNGVRAVISYQEGLGDNYIHWATTGLTSHQLTHGSSPSFGRRIYLNPEPAFQTEIFTSVMQRLDQAGLTVGGKMIDRALELAVASAANPAVGKEENVRADGIVLGLVAAEADVALRITEDVYKENYAAFRGRPTPKIPQKVAEGVAVSDESPDVKESLTTHRAIALGAAAEAARQVLGFNFRQGQHFDARQLRNAFEASWRSVAATSGINFKNFAWNLHA